MRTVKVGASFGGKIPTGSYQNMSPSFYAEEIIELADSQDANDYIMKRQQALQAICYSNFEAEAIKAKVLKIQGDRKDFHWGKLPNGEEVPSVTSIIGFDVEFYPDENEMRQYASQGTIIHGQVAHFIKTGNWVEPKEILDLTADMFIVKNGSLGLPLFGWDFPAFLKKYPFTGLKNGKQIFNSTDKYCGTYDFEGIHADLATLVDVKRTPDKIKNFMQIAAYAKGEGMEHIKQMMIAPINDKTDQGFSKPILTTEIDRYYELFLAKRRAFKKVYGI